MAAGHYISLVHYDSGCKLSESDACYHDLCLGHVNHGFENGVLGDLVCEM